MRNSMIPEIEGGGEVARGTRLESENQLPIEHAQRLPKIYFDSEMHCDQEHY
jgi:hypothetical protein